MYHPVFKGKMPILFQMRNINRVNMWEMQNRMTLPIRFANVFNMKSYDENPSLGETKI
jgi:hypothetical protein